MQPTWDKECEERELMDGYSDFIENGKKKINEVLYPLVPEHMTIGEFEDLSVAIFERIRDVWDKRMLDGERSHEV